MRKHVHVKGVPALLFTVSVLAGWVALAVDIAGWLS